MSLTSRHTYRAEVPVAAQPASSGAALEAVVRAAVAGTGFELEDVQEVGAGKRRLIRVVVDADTGIGLDDIATVSRAVSVALDDHDDLFTGPYTLEVSSPGVDRPLTQARHWRRNRLRLVRATLVDGGELIGRVGDCDDECVTLLVAGALRRLCYAKLDRAVVEVEFGPPPATELAALGGAQSQGSTAHMPAGQTLAGQKLAGRQPAGQDLEER